MEKKGGEEGHGRRGGGGANLVKGSWAHWETWNATGSGTSASGCVTLSRATAASRSSSAGRSSAFRAAVPLSSPAITGAPANLERFQYMKQRPRVWSGHNTTTTTAAVIIRHQNKDGRASQTCRGLRGASQGDPTVAAEGLTSSGSPKEQRPAVAPK